MDAKLIQKLNIPTLREVSVETSKTGVIFKLVFWKEESVDLARQFFFKEGNNPIVKSKRRKKAIWLSFDKLKV